MIFGLFKSEPVLDEATVMWLFDTYGWALRQFDAKLFRDETVLVLPNDRFFPGRVNSVDGMTALVCDKVKEYANITHWPTRLVDGRVCQTGDAPRLVLAGAPRQPHGTSPVAVEEGQQLSILYDPAMVNGPEVMISYFAHTFAHYLATMATEPPPGGEENWPHATEVLATFLGFGLMFANSAFTARVPRCGSCGPAPVERQSFLSQYDMTYALAIFSALKGIPNSDVLPHLKGSLRGFYKRATKDVAGRVEELTRLRSLL